MPVALLLIGILFLTAAVRGKHGLLFETLRDDFTGPNNFLYWGLAFFVIGAAGYWKPLKPLSNAFMLLVVVVLFLSNRGFFNKFMDQLGQTQRKSSALAALGNPSGESLAGAIRERLYGPSEERKKTIQDVGRSVGLDVQFIR